eukprot:3397810-Pleurochrysis_carterae.AAC.7
MTPCYARGVARALAHAAGTDVARGAKPNEHDSIRVLRTCIRQALGDWVSAAVPLLHRKITLMHYRSLPVTCMFCVPKTSLALAATDVLELYSLCETKLNIETPSIRKH